MSDVGQDCVKTRFWLERAGPDRQGRFHARRPARTRGGKPPPRGSARCGRAKRRMIRDSVLDTELAEPAIGKAHLHFAADQPLRTDRKDIPNDQHPDHQFRIDRWATHGRIMSCKFAAKPRQIESSIDLPHQMIVRNRVVEVKLIK